MNTEAIDANEAESSTSNEVQQDHDVDAQSSSAEGELTEIANEDEAEVSLLAIVQREAKDTREGSIVDEEPPTSEDQEQVAEQASDTDEAEQQEEGFGLDEFGFSPEEMKALKGKTKDRFNELLQQRDEFRGKAEEAEIIKTFMQENKISSDEMARMMGTLAHFNAGDYQGFLDGIQPLMDHAGTALGVNLPPDIQKRVDDGYVDPDSAAELAANRAASVEQQARLQYERGANQYQTQQAEATHIKSSVDSWEADIRKSDPDYAQKENQIRANARALMAQFGQPVNADQALQLSKDAYEMTNEFIRQANPKPRAINPGPSSGSVPNAHAEPKSMLDAVRQGIRNAQTGA